MLVVNKGAVTKKAVEGLRPLFRYVSPQEIGEGAEKS